MPTAYNQERGLRESLEWALKEIEQIPRNRYVRACLYCDAQDLPNGTKVHEKHCQLRIAQSRVNGFDPTLTWPANPDLFEFPDWVCQKCYLHERGGEGQPTICPSCGSNKWEQEDLTNEYRRVPAQDTVRSRRMTEHRAHCNQHIGVGFPAYHIGYAIEDGNKWRLFECTFCSHRFTEPHGMECDTR